MGDFAADSLSNDLRSGFVAVMLVYRLAGLVLLLGCGAVRKPPEPSRRLDLHADGEMFETDRGYRFAVLQEPAAKLVALDVRYPVGAADDPPGKEGLAHLVEHLMFDIEFTRGETRTSIGAELGRISIGYNAETRLDSTTYTVLAEPKALDELLELEVDRLAVGCAGLSPEIVAREREVVINELRQNQGVSGADLQRQLTEAVYPAGHRYRRVDSIDTVAKLELPDVCDFIKTAYRRGKAMVVASGMVDAHAVRLAATRYFMRLGKRDLTPSPPPPVAEARPGTQRVKVDIDEPTLVVTWPLPRMATIQYRLLRLGWSAIGPRLAGMGFEFGWGHSPSTWIIGGAYAPVLAVSVTLASADHLDDAIDAAEKAAAYAARAVYRPGDGPESIAWRKRMEGGVESLLANWELLGSRNAMFADYMQFDPDHGSLVARVAELVGTHPSTVHDLIEQWLTPARAHYLLLEPSGKPSAHAQLGYAGGAAEHPTPVDGALADKPLDVPVDGLAIATERYKLGNGLSVILWPHGDAPLVHGRLVIDSGLAHDPIGKEGAASLVGADGVDVDTLVFSERDLAIRPDETIFSLASNLRSPQVTLSDEDSKFLVGRLRQGRAKERASYNLAIATALYGAGHPYARPTLSENSLANLSTDVVTTWARTHLVPKNATLILAGKFDAELIKKHIAYDLDQVSAGSDSPDRSEPAHTTRGFVAGATEKPSLTVELAAHFVSGTGIDRDYPKRLVLEQVLGSQLARLRSTDALTYGFGASYSPRRAGGLWTIGGEANAARAFEAAKALMVTLAEMRRDPETYRAAFVLGRQQALEAVLVGATSSAAIVDRLELIARFHLTDDYYDTVADEIAALTLADFHKFVVRELADKALVLGAFGNREVVDAALAGAHVAEKP